MSINPTYLDMTPEERDAICRTDLCAFTEAALAELEPTNPFQWNWHHEAMAVVLENATGKKTRCFINAPPRSAKSSIASVIWVAFLLGHEPTHKFICASYSRDLAEHFGAQCRRLMQSKFY